LTPLETHNRTTTLLLLVKTEISSILQLLKMLNLRGIQGEKTGVRKYALVFMSLSWNSGHSSTKFIADFLHNFKTI